MHTKTPFPGALAATLLFASACDPGLDLCEQGPAIQAGLDIMEPAYRYMADKAHEGVLDTKTVDETYDLMGNQLAANQEIVEMAVLSTEDEDGNTHAEADVRTQLLYRPTSFAGYSSLIAGRLMKELTHVELKCVPGPVYDKNGNVTESPCARHRRVTVEDTGYASAAALQRGLLWLEDNGEAIDIDRSRQERAAKHLDKILETFKKIRSNEVAAYLAVACPSTVARSVGGAADSRTARVSDRPTGSAAGSGSTGTPRPGTGRVKAAI